MRRRCRENDGANEGSLEPGATRVIDFSLFLGLVINPEGLIKFQLPLSHSTASFLAFLSPGEAQPGPLLSGPPPRTARPQIPRLNHLELRFNQRPLLQGGRLGGREAGWEGGGLPGAVERLESGEVSVKAGAIGPVRACQYLTLRYFVHYRCFVFILSFLPNVTLKSYLSG